MCDPPADRRSSIGTVLEAFDCWQRRHAAAAFPVAVVRKFVDDRASNLAALIAYYAFFSLFPLLLVFVSVLGFVLQDDPALQEDVVDSALARIPVVGAQLGDDVEPLTGSTSALVIGLAGALWAGLGVTLALGRAFEEIWDVPAARAARRTPGAGARAGRPGGPRRVAHRVDGRGGPRRRGPDRAGRGGARCGRRRARHQRDGLPRPVRCCSRARPRRLPELLPGVALAAAGALALQAAGGWYVERAVTSASDTYGTFALVIGLLSWFWLGAHSCSVRGGERRPAPSPLAPVPWRSARGRRPGGAAQTAEAARRTTTGDPGPLRRRRLVLVVERARGGAAPHIRLREVLVLGLVPGRLAHRPSRSASR